MVKSLTDNSTSLAVGRIAAQGLVVLSTVVVARGLGTVAFGQYAFVGAVVALANVVTTFGTDSLLIREIAGGREEPGRLLSAAIALQLVLSCALVAVIVLCAGLLPNRTDETILALRVYALALLPLAVSGVYSAAVRAWERMDLYAAFIVANAALQTVVALVALHYRATLSQLMLGFALVQVAVVGLSWQLCRVARPGFSLARRPTADALGRLLARAWPLALLTGIGMLGQRLGVLLLSFIAGDAPAGWFAAAARVVEGLKLVDFAILGSMLPLASRLAAEGTVADMSASRERLARLVRRARVVLVAVALIAAIGASTMGGPLVALLYGHAYDPAVGALRILAWTLVPYAASAPFAVALVSTGHERAVIRAEAVGVLVAAVLGILLIPVHGVAGGSEAILLGEVGRAAMLLVAGGRIATPRFAAGSVS